MPLIEVEDAVLAALRDNGVRYNDKTQAAQRAGEAETLWNKLLANAKTRPRALELYKEQYPEVPVPEIDAAAEVRAEIAALRKEREDEKAAAAQEREDAQKRREEAAAHDTVSKGRTWLRRERKLDDEGVSAVEKMMTDIGIANYEVAFSHWKASQPPDPEQLPSSVVNRSLDWFKVSEEQPDHKKMLEDPIAWRRGQIHKILTEERTKSAA